MLVLPWWVRTSYERWKSKKSLVSSLSPGAGAEETDLISLLFLGLVLGSFQLVPVLLGPAHEGEVAISPLHRDPQVWVHNPYHEGMVVLSGVLAWSC
jgi:hypothetical protein